MRLDASRFNLFWQNPDRFRLRELCRLSPIEPSAGTYASLLSFGRRRGTCFHELLDAAYRGVAENEAVQSLKDGGFGEKEITVAQQMAARVRELYPGESYLAHEALFECVIPGSSHALVGRIDHILPGDDGPIVGDWKTSKYRPKDELARKGEEYCKSVQVGFYLLGARSLGFDTRRFLYRLVSSGRKTARPEIKECPAERTQLELNELMRSVDQTCELILWLKEKYGLQRSWPVLPERFTTGYESIIGRPAYPGFVPEGFEPKVDHLPIDLQMGVD